MSRSIQLGGSRSNEMSSATQIAPEDPATHPLDVRPGDDGGVPEARQPEDRILWISLRLWKQRRELLRTAGVGALLAFVLALLTPNQYKSTARLMPPENQGGASGLAAVASRLSASDLVFGGDLFNAQGNGALFLGILRSRTAQERLVAKFDLTLVPGRWFGTRSRSEDACRELERNTEITEDRKSGIITISVVDSDPNRAAALVEGYVDQLNQLSANLNTSAARREREFLEQRLAEVKKDLDSASRELSDFSSKNGTFDPRDQDKSLVEAAAALQGEMIAAESQLKGLEQVYTSDNVQVKSLRSRIAELRRQLQKLSHGSKPGSRSADDPVSEMLFPSLRQLPILGARYADLYRRAKTQETVFQVLTQQYEMSKVQEAKEIPTVRVLDVADVPDRKVGPHRLLLALMGAISGLLVGCAWAIAKGQWDTLPPDSPRKSFLLEIAGTARRQPLWRTSKRGLSQVAGIRARFIRSRNPASGSPEEASRNL